MAINFRKDLKNNSDSGRYYAKVTKNGALVTTGGDGERDAFGRLRVSEVYSQMDLKQINDALPLFYDTELIGDGTATWSKELASSLLETSAEGDAVIKQTFQRGNYQSGKGQQIFITFAHFQPETNITKRVGYFSSNTTTPFNSNLDGVFIESGSDGIKAVVYRNGVVIDEALQEDWDDALDGSGDSGFLIDWEQTQICLISFEWLGVGSMDIAFVIDGLIINAVRFKHANNIGDVYMSSPNQPVRYEIRQTGVGSGSLKQICASVGSEGSLNEIGKILSVNTASTPLAASTAGTTYAAIGIRLKAAQVGTQVDILDFNALVTTNTDGYWSAILNPSVAGTFTYSDVTNSSIQRALGATANTVTGGTVLSSGYIKASGIGQNIGANISGEIINAIRLGQKINGVVDTIVFCFTPLSNTASIYSSLSWRERS